MSIASAPKITWETPPEGFVLPDEPVDNLSQPVLAAALTESLELADRIPPQALIGTNFGICATIDGKLAIKAPDWFYVASVLPLAPTTPDRRSYTPVLEGEIPLIVMEFLSATEGGEYSIKAKFPPGKWYFYEQIVKVPIYAIFEPVAGWLEVYRLDNSGQYSLQQPDQDGRYWIEELSLFLGIWQGIKANREGFWLRWWDAAGERLLWGVERSQQAEQLRDRMIAKLREYGLNPDDL